MLHSLLRNSCQNIIKGSSSASHGLPIQDGNKKQNQRWQAVGPLSNHFKGSSKSLGRVNRSRGSAAQPAEMGSVMQRSFDGGAPTVCSETLRRIGINAQIHPSASLCLIDLICFDLP